VAGLGALRHVFVFERRLDNRITMLTQTGLSVSIFQCPMAVPIPVLHQTDHDD
jgi:hypothetical protein